MKTLVIDDLVADDRFVRRLARRLIGDANSAEDVAQDTWLQTLVRGPKAAGSIRGWLAKAAAHAASDLRRSRARRARRESRAARPEAQDPESAFVEREEIRRKVCAAVLALGPPRSTVLLLRYFEGAPNRVIAKRLGMPVATVRTHTRRGIEQLRSRLASERGPDGGSLLTALPLLGSASHLVSGSLGAVAMAVKSKFAVAGALLLAGAVCIARLDAEARAPQDPPAVTTASAAAPQGDRRAAPDSGTSRPAVGSASFVDDAAADSSPDRWTVGGDVVDEAGRPIAGAHVLACDGGDLTAVALDGDAGTVPSAVGATTSDTEGRFSLGLKPPDRHVTLVATARGFSPTIAPAVAAGAQLRLTLGGAVTIAGRTLDTSGAPIQGARVRWSAQSRGATISRRAKSGDDGRFTIGDLPSGALAQEMTFGVALDAEADGFAPLAVSLSDSKHDLATPGRVVEQDLVLVRGVTAKGRVIDAETGDPIPGAEVSFRSWSSAEEIRAAWDRPPTPDRRTRSDERGAYMFERLPSLGFHRLPSRVAGSPVGELRSAPPGFAECRAQVPSQAEGTVVEIELPCWPTARVSGRVVDSTGRAMAGFAVWAFVRGLGNVQTRSTPSDAAGRFVLDAIPTRRSSPTQVEIVANPAGSNVVPPGAAPFARATVSLASGADVVLPDLVADPMPFVRLRVADAAGRVVRGAEARSMWLGAPAVTDVDGRCTLYFASDDPARPHFARIRAPGFGSTLVANLTPSKTPATEVEVALKAGTRVCGRVLWSDGSPVRDAQVSLSEDRPPTTAAPPASSRISNDDDRLTTFRASTSTDGEGRFDFDDLPGGPFRCEAHVRAPGAPGDAASIAEARRDDVRAGATDLELRFDVGPSADVRGAAAVVSGAVVVGTTKRAPTSFTAVLLQGGTLLSAVSPTLGRFRFDAVPSGRWTLQVEAPGFVPFERVVDVAAGGAAVHLDVSLDEGLVVSGVVRAAAGVRLAGVSLLLERTDIDAWTLAGVGADGVFRASGLTAGRYRVSVTYPNAGIWDKALCPTRTLVLDVSASSSPMRCDVEVVRGGWLNFGVSKGLVAGRSDVRLKFTDADSRVVYDEPIEPERCGILWTSAFPVGAYNIRLEAGGALLAEKQATVVDGTPAKVYFDG